MFWKRKVWITLCCVSCILILSGSLAISTSESRFLSDSSNHSMSLFQDSWNWRVTRNKHGESPSRSEWEPITFRPASSSMEQQNNFKKSRPHLFGSLSGVVQLPPSLHRPLHQLLPAALHAEQQVLNQHHVLLLAEIFQVCSRLVQVNDVVPVGVHLRHKHLDEGRGKQTIKMRWRQKVVLPRGDWRRWTVVIELTMHKWWWI